MKFYFFCVIFIGIITQKYSKRTSQTTPLYKRIEQLKQQLRSEIKDKIISVEDKLSFSGENYDYMEGGKITPIVKTRLRKRHRLYARNATPPVTVRPTVRMTFNKSQLRSKMQLKKVKKFKNKKPLEIFYRRFNEDMLHDQLPWAHCQYMITPFLTGMQNDLTKASKLLTAKDPTIVRLIQLLRLNATDMNKEDVYSILYQISNLQIRLFQWADPPIKLLLNTVIKDKSHTFRTLKYSIQALFASWRLDISNATSLLKQTRLFRPPCIRVTDLDGSTKSPKMSTFPKKTQPTTKCDDDSDESI